MLSLIAMNTPDGPSGADPVEALLGQLSALRAGDDDPVDDRALIDLRAGRLDADAEAATRATLLGSAAARGVFMAQAQLPTAAAEAEALQALEAVADAPTEAATPAARPAWLTWKFWLGSAGLLAAAAAAAIVLMARPPMPDVPDYQGVLKGAVAQQRGVEAPDGRRFVPTSQVTVLLRPQGEVAQAVAPQVFVGPADGPLRAAPAAALTQGDGGAWRFRARADGLFQASGPKVVLVLFAAQPVDAVGQTAQAVSDDWAESARIVRVPLDYDAKGGR